MFIAITSEVYNQKLVLINTSYGKRLFDPNGIGLDDALDFLFSLRHLRKRKTSVHFVAYGFSRDNEFLFSLLNRQLRDKLFQSAKIKQELSALETEQELLDTKFYNGSEDREQADFERYVNRLAIQELKSVSYNGYDIKLANGKRLTISREGKSITIYDIYGFFRPHSLRRSVKEYCGVDLEVLDRAQLVEDFELAQANSLDRVLQYSDIEVQQIAELAAALNDKLREAGIVLRRWHGATAVTSWFLGQSKARKEYHNYRYARQLSPQLNDAVHSAFFAGRAEQLKLGTLENVYTYDINSAYAYAASILPRMLVKPSYQKKYMPLPFSLWSVKFDFRGVGRRLGIFPFRQRRGVTFPLTGQGYYWQPEIDYALRHYPECVKVGYGFALDAPQADFAAKIPDLYRLRQQLKEANSPIEKIIKLALASIYGKFCQHNGAANFYNLFYAGFITSFVRRMLLDASHDIENAIICFLTDCIHSTRPLAVSQGIELGQWKAQKYAKIRYLDNGVYECYDERGRAVKTKTKGFKAIRFDAATYQLQKTKKFSTISEFFVGHNVFSQHLWEDARYLENITVEKENQPLFNAGRRFNYEGENLLENHVNSLPLVGDPQKVSLPYSPAQFKDADFAIDSIEARRRLC